MVRTGYDVGDDLGLCRIWNGWFQHTDYSCGTSTEFARIEFHGLPDHGRIFLHDCIPEAVRQDHSACCIRTVIVCVKQTAEHRVQSHHVEIGSVDHSGADLTRIAESDHREADGRKVAEGTQ